MLLLTISMHTFKKRVVTHLINTNLEAGTSNYFLGYQRVQNSNGNAEFFEPIVKHEGGGRKAGEANVI